MACKDNSDICAVLSRMVALERFDASTPVAHVPGIGRDSLDEVLLDHAHHEDRWPRLLHELAPSRAA